MNDKQPKALFLAEALDGLLNSVGYIAEDAADELRRLHEVEKQRDELLHALKLCRAAIANSAAQELRRLHEAEEHRDELLYASRLCRTAITKAEKKV